MHSRSGAETLAKQCALVRSSNKRHEFVNEIMFLDGYKSIYLSDKFPLPGPKGEAFVGVVTIEISEELRSKAMDSLLASIVEVSPDAIYTVSADGMVTSWNKASETIFGYAALGNYRYVGHASRSAA